MSELANLTPQQKAGCEQLIIESMNITGSGKFLQPPRVRFRCRALSRQLGAASTWSFMPLLIPRASTYHSQCHFQHGFAAGDAVRKPDGSYDMRDGYQWFWDKVLAHALPGPALGAANLYAVNVNSGAILWHSILGVTD